MTPFQLEGTLWNYRPWNLAAYEGTVGPHFAAGGRYGGLCQVLPNSSKKSLMVWFTVGIDTYGSVFKKYKETGEFDENEI